MQAGRVPKQVRQALIQSFVWSRTALGGRQSLPPLDGFVTWPPVGSPDEYKALVTRLYWYLPTDASSVSVFIPAHGPFAAPSDCVPSSNDGLADPTVPKGEIRIVGGLRDAPRAAAVLVWRALSCSLLRAVPRWRNIYVIDHDLFWATEQLEWMNLFERWSDSNKGAQADASRAAFGRLLSRVEGIGEINVFGNGPGLRKAYDSDLGNAANIICNTAAQAQTVVDYLKPVALALVYPLYFGPSILGRDVMQAVVQCARRHGTFILVPAGYAYHLLKTNYPGLEPFLIGFDMVRDKVVLPSESRLEVTVGRNVVTSLMLPVAAALKPRRIGVWGCDGRSAGDKQSWSYMPGLDPKLDTAARAHPSYFRDRNLTPAHRDKEYARHCEYMETLIERIETTGIEVVCRSASTIPALLRRADLQAPSEAAT